MKDCFAAIRGGPKSRRLSVSFLSMVCCFAVAGMKSGVDYLDFSAVTFCSKTGKEGTMSPGRIAGCRILLPTPKAPGEGGK